MANTLKLVFSDSQYVILASTIFVGLLILLFTLSEYVFFEPYFVFYVPSDRVVGFALIIGVSILSSLVIPMNIYMLNVLQKAKKISGGFVGSLIGASAGACSCGPVGFAIISTFGTVGGLATAFLTTYEIPLRLVSVGVLGYIYYSTTKSLSADCKIS